MNKFYIYLKKYYPILLGGLGGYLYYFFIGCASGSCPITSNPYISIIYGGLIGGILIIGKNKK